MDGLSVVRTDRPTTGGLRKQRSSMALFIRNRPLARLAGTAAVIGQLAGAYFFLLYPALTVPSPVNYLFPVAWAILLGLAIASWRHHPLRAFVIPVVSVPICVLFLELGTRFLGWAP
jgi:hypothetical protein